MPCRHNAADRRIFNPPLCKYHMASDKCAICGGSPVHIEVDKDVYLCEACIYRKRGDYIARKGN